MVEEVEEKREDRGFMATAPVGRLMLKIGIPMILSMMLQAVYNIVDSAFVSAIPEVGEEGINALTLAFPVQMLIVAIAIGTGVGCNALLAKSLGQGDKEKASKTASNALFLAAIIFIVFVLFGIFGVDIYIRSQSENEVIVGMADSYLRICSICSFGIVFFSIFEKVLQATGRSLYSTIAQVAGAVANMILDPIFIFGWLGLPAMGVTGAAIATVIGQILSFALALFFHLKKDVEIENNIKFFKPDGKIIKEIYAIGLPAIIAQALMSILTYLLNIIFVKIGENVVTAYGLYYKIQQFILFAAFGLRDAITPIVSFNHGMKSEKRVMAGIRYGLLYTIVIMTAGLIALEIFAEPLAGLFGLSGETEALCVSAIRIISLSFIFAGINIAFQGIFQALDGGMESLIVSVLRQFAFVLPPAVIFTNMVLKGFSFTGIIWFSFLIAEGLTAIVGAFLLKRIIRTKVKKVEKNEKAVSMKAETAEV